jgi:hypothetical protein
VIQPDVLRATFGVDAEVLATPGGPVVWLR